MLLQTSFVGKLPRTVWAFERSLNPIMGSLKMVIEKSLLSEIFVASFADKWSLTSVDPVVDIEMGFSGIRLLTNCAYKRFLA